MLAEITYYMIFGKPLILYLGLLAFLGFSATASVAVLTMKGIRRFPVSTHKALAAVSFLLALVHMALGLLAYF